MSEEDIGWLSGRNYDYTEHLTRTQWAWEFLRRNRAYAGDWRPLRQSLIVHRANACSVSFPPAGHQGVPSRWGCFFGDNPAQPGNVASVLWDPGICSAILRVYSLSAGNCLSPAYDLLAYPQLTLVLRMSDGSHQLLFRDGAKALQVHLWGTDLSESAHLLVDVSTSHLERSSWMQGLKSFKELLTEGRLRSGLLPVGRRGARLRVFLQALDGRLAGASYREIAVALFGHGRVVDDWNAHGEYLKSRVRRAVDEGIYLMQGGYMDLLR